MDKSKVKAGSNWKKLQKTLTPQTRSNDQRVKQLRRGKGLDAVKGKEKERESSSPAPTTLPWFAEDLSPEDLALVRTNSGLRKSLELQVQHAGTAQNSLNSAALTPEEALSRHLAALGGGKESDTKGEAGKYVAIDCEMVGVGPKGSESVLARVSIVNWHGAILIDTFVQPREQVTDYRTWVSGVRRSDLETAPSFQEVQSKVAKIIDGRILVGHALHNDMNALLLSHPRLLTRDTASYPGARKLANSKYPSLRKLVALQLGIEIQQQGAAHSSVEDARATMALYRTFHAEWQQSLSHISYGKASKKKRPSPSVSSSSSKVQIIGPGWKGSGKDKTKNETSSKKRHSISNDDAEWWKSV